MADIDPSIVRVGTAADVDGMMDISLRASAENGFVNPSPVRLLAEMWPALVRDHGLVGIIGAPGEQIEAAVLLRIGTMWYSDDPVVEEKAIFVHPDYRRGKLNRARTLCAFSKQVADSLEIPLIIGVLSNSRTEAKVRLYEREFGTPSGAFFMYGAKTGAFSEAEH